MDSPLRWNPPILVPPSYGSRQLKLKKYSLGFANPTSIRLDPSNSGCTYIAPSTGPSIPRSILLPSIGLGRHPFISPLMQRPTLQGVRIRSTRDALQVFNGVATNRLPLITRRLDAEERRAIVPGNVYVWCGILDDTHTDSIGLDRAEQGGTRCKHRTHRPWDGAVVRDSSLVGVYSWLTISSVGRTVWVGVQVVRATISRSLSLSCIDIPHTVG